MSKYAVMPLTDYIAACDAIREKMGDSEAIKSGDMAEEIGKVYAAGKLAILAESNYMHPTVSGSVVSVSDVSPTKHELTVNLSSDTVTDFSGVTVSRYGKNLINIPNLENLEGNGTLKQLYETNKVITCGGVDTFLSCTPVINEELSSSGTGNLVYVNITFASGFVGNYTLYANNGDNYGKLISTATYGDIRKMIIYQHNRWTGGNLSVTNIQLEIGTKSTEFEPHKEPQTVTANADGTVEGITSISPNMTLITDTEGVVINCQYYRDIDTYIDNLITDVAISGGE